MTERTVLRAHSLPPLDKTPKPRGDILLFQDGLGTKGGVSGRGRERRHLPALPSHYRGGVPLWPLSQAGSLCGARSLLLRSGCNTAFFTASGLSTMNSVRRFMARPAEVSLLAIGLVSPRPIDCIRSPAMPTPMRKSRTALARRSESFWLYSSEPTESVLPSTRIRRSGYSLSTWASSFRIG